MSTTISMPRHGRNYSLRAAIPADQAAYLERRAQLERTSVASLVRQAIDGEMARKPLGPERKDQES